MLRPKNREHLGKFDKKSDEAIFLRYSMNRRAYRVFNKRILMMKESINVASDDLKSATTKIKIYVVFSDNELETSSRTKIKGSQKDEEVSSQQSFKDEDD